MKKHILGIGLNKTLVLLWGMMFLCFGVTALGDRVVGGDEVELAQGYGVNIVSSPYHNQTVIEAWGDGDSARGNVFSDDWKGLGKGFFFRDVATIYGVANVNKDQFMLFYYDKDNYMATGQFLKNFGEPTGNKVEIREGFPSGPFHLTDDLLLVEWLKELPTMGRDYYGQLIYSANYTLGESFRINDEPVKASDTSYSTGVLDGVGFVTAYLNFASKIDSSGAEVVNSRIEGYIFDTFGRKIGNKFTFDKQTFIDAIAVTFLDKEKFLIIYGDSSRVGIYAQVFAINGETMGTELKIDDYNYPRTAAPNPFPTVVMDMNTFVALWPKKLDNGMAKIMGGMFKYDDSGLQYLDTSFQANVSSLRSPILDLTLVKGSESEFMVTLEVPIPGGKESARGRSFKIIQGVKS